MFSKLIKGSGASAPGGGPSITVSGVAGVKSTLSTVGAGLTGHPMKRVMDEIVAIVTRDARLGAPVDTGMLKNSITGYSEAYGTGDKHIQGVVGSNLSYAPYMELGAKPHWPPLSALQVWARRHGIPAYVVAKKIAMKGIKPRYYLKKAHDKNESYIKQRIADGVKGLITGP